MDLPPLLEPYESWIKLFGTFGAALTGAYLAQRRRGDPVVVALRERQLDACQTILERAMEYSHYDEGTAQDVHNRIRDHWNSLRQLRFKYLAVIPERVLRTLEALEAAQKSACEAITSPHTGPREIYDSFDRITEKQILLMYRIRRALQTEKGASLARRFVDPLHWIDALKDWWDNLGMLALAEIRKKKRMKEEEGWKARRNAAGVNLQQDAPITTNADPAN